MTDESGDGYTDFSILFLNFRSFESANVFLHSTSGLFGGIIASESIDELTFGIHEVEKDGVIDEIIFAFFDFSRCGKVDAEGFTDLFDFVVGASQP